MYILNRDCGFLLQYEYFNAVLINERDEEGNYLELGLGGGRHGLSVLAAAQGRTTSWWGGLHLYHVHCLLCFSIIWKQRLLAEWDCLEMVKGWTGYS